LPDYNPQKPVDESIYHWYTGGENQKLKKLCMGGSDCKIGCSWDQFGDNASDAVESICRQLFDLRMTMQHDRPSKSTYYIVKDEQAAERLLNGPLFYEGKKIEFFQTVHYEEEVMIITIPSFKDVQGETLFKAACKTLSKYGTVKDASARFVRGTSTMVPFGMKILFAKNSEKDMPNFIKVQKSRVVAGVYTDSKLRELGFEFSAEQYKLAKKKVNEILEEFSNASTKTLISRERNGENTIQPIRFLRNTKIHIYNQFKLRFPEAKLSLSKFYALCAKHYQKSSKKTDICFICVAGNKAKLDLKKAKNSNIFDFFRIAMLQKLVNDFEAHQELEKMQKNTFKDQKQQLDKESCIVIADFKENFRIGGGPVESGNNFYQKTLLGLKEIKDFKKVNFWSDSGPQFKNGDILYSFLMDFQQCYADKKNFINFFTEKHGKSDVDCHFGVLSRCYKDLEATRKISSIIDIKESFEEKERDRNLFKSSSARKSKFSFGIYPKKMPQTERKKILVKDGIKLYQYYFMDGMFLKESVKPSQQTAKEDKQLAEAEQQILDLGRIAIHIEELARGLEGIQNPSEPEVKGFAQEITGSAQDLLRLAFNYSSKIKLAMRTAIATTSGYDGDTATSAPESEFAETQYLFHPEVISRMEEHRSKSRNDKLLRIAISGKIPNGFQRPRNQSYQNNRGGYFRGGHGNRGGYRGGPNQYNQSYRPPSYTNNQQRQGPKQSTGQSSFTDHPTGLRDIRKSVSDDTGDDHETGKILSKNRNVVPRDTPGHSLRNLWVRSRTRAKPPKEQGRLLVKARQEHVGRQYFEEWVSDTTYPVTHAHTSKVISPGSSPLGSHRHDGQGIPAVWNDTGGSGYGYDLCIPDIWKRRAYKDPPTTGYDAYQRICSQRRLQNGGCEVPEGLDSSIRSYIQAGCKVSLSPHSPPSIFLEDVPIYLSKHNIRIPMSSIWADNSTQNLLQDDEGCYRASQSNGNTSSVLHRRHCDTWEDRGGVPQTHSDYLKPPSDSGILYKCREIDKSSQYQPNIPRIHVQH
ncbi:hypothetical protein BB560_005871, partial [Smittium megazygosporum]